MDDAGRQNLITLLTEVFEGIQGDGTWFVDTQPNQGFLGMTDVSAEVASWLPGHGLHSIAAHTIHVRFATGLLNAFARGEQPALDWEGTWKVQQVDEVQWAEIRRTLRREYEDAKKNIAVYDFSDPDTATGTTALVAHVAWHLGTVKHLRAFQGS